MPGPLAGYEFWWDIGYVEPPGWEGSGYYVWYITDLIGDAEAFFNPYEYVTFTYPNGGYFDKDEYKGNSAINDEDGSKYTYLYYGSSTKFLNAPKREGYTFAKLLMVNIYMIRLITLKEILIL